MWRAWIIPVLGLAACTDFPQVDAALSQNGPSADYPEISPFEQLKSDQVPRLTGVDDDALRARAEALRARVGGLRGPVIDPDTRDRMTAGVAQP